MPEAVCLALLHAGTLKSSRSRASESSRVPWTGEKFDVPCAISREGVSITLSSLAVLHTPPPSLIDDEMIFKKQFLQVSL